MRNARLWLDSFTPPPNEGYAWLWARTVKGAEIFIKNFETRWDEYDKIIISIGSKIEGDQLIDYLISNKKVSPRFSFHIHTDGKDKEYFRSKFKEFMWIEIP
jgi:hypothetical protein